MSDDAGAVRLRFAAALYDEDAVRETADEFRPVARVTVRKLRDGLSVTVGPPRAVAGDDADLDTLAGELANIALARTLEARQG